MLKPGLKLAILRSRFKGAADHREVGMVPSEGPGQGLRCVQADVVLIWV